MDELGQQPIVETMQLFTKVWWGLQQEPAQSLRVRIIRQPGQILKGAVPAQQRGGFKTVQSEHDRIDQRQDHLRKTVIVIGPRIMQAPREPVSQLQHSEKIVEKENTSVVRKATVVKGDS